jgi:hypothetical protein
VYPGRSTKFSTRSSTFTKFTTGLVPLERELTLTTAAYSTTRIQGKPALIHAVMDPSEAIGIGRGAYSREKILAPIEPPEQISAAAYPADAIRQILEKK